MCEVEYEVTPHINMNSNQLFLFPLFRPLALSGSAAWPSVRTLHQNTCQLGSLKSLFVRYLAATLFTKYICLQPATQPPAQSFSLLLQLWQDTPKPFVMSPSLHGQDTDSSAGSLDLD